MNVIRSFATIALIGSLAVLPACGADRGARSEEDSSLIGKAMSKAMVEAREEIRTGNISISSGKDSKLPKAEITPKGDLLIDGSAVALNDQQRALVLDYREHLAGVAESGMEIGVQGADLAGKALGEVARGLLNGKSEKEIEQSIEAEAAHIKASAAKLCERLPAMMASQQTLAAAVPEFKPYATMTQDDVDDCYKDTDDDTPPAPPSPPAPPAPPEAPDPAN